MASAVGGNLNDSIFSVHFQYCKRCEQHLLNPQVLSCLHVLCEQCLMYLLYAAQGNLTCNDYSIVCPECKKTVTVGLSGVGSEVKHASISSSTLFYCSSCVKDTNSVFRCQYCTMLYCLSCFREHSFVSCAQDVKGAKFEVCMEHNMDFKYYCLKCEVPACVFCLTNKHKNNDHKYVSITEAEKDVRNHLEKLLDNAKDHTNQCYGTISCILEVLTNLRNKHVSAKEEIVTIFQSFMKLCDKYHKDATKELNAVYLQEESKIKKLLHEIEDFSARIGGSCKVTKKLLMEADATALVRLRKSLPAQLPELNLQVEMNSTVETGLVQALNITFEDVLNDFHEKMRQNHDELMKTLSSKSLEFPYEPLDDPAAESNLQLLPFKKDHTSILSQQQYKKMPLNLKYRFGSMGEFNAEFTNPSGFCLGINDDIIVADSCNHRIQIFAKNGTFKFKFGIPGKMEGHLWFPAKIAVTPTSNRFIICDQGVERSRLQMFSKNGIFIKKIPFYDVAIPSALAVTLDGYIVIADRSIPVAYIIDEMGQIIRSFQCTNYVVEASDIAVYDSEIYICDFKGHCVAVFGINGVFQRFIGNKDVFCYPNGVHVYGNDVFVSDTNNSRFHIARFARNGLFKALYECTQSKITHCCGLKMNSDGNIFTLSRSHHCMFVIDKIIMEPLN